MTLNSISPNPSTVGTSTSASVHFADVSTGSSSITVKCTNNIVNSSGTVVFTGSTSLSMKNGSTKDYILTFKPTATGTYTVQGIATNSSGTVLGENLNLGKLTVN